MCPHDPHPPFFRAFGAFVSLLNVLLPKKYTPKCTRYSLSLSLFPFLDPPLFELFFYSGVKPTDRIELETQRHRDTTHKLKLTVAKANEWNVPRVSSFLHPLFILILLLLLLLFLLLLLRFKVPLPGRLNLSVTFLSSLSFFSLRRSLQH